PQARHSTQNQLRKAPRPPALPHISASGTLMCRPPGGSEEFVGLFALTRAASVALTSARPGDASAAPSAPYSAANLLRAAALLVLALALLAREHPEQPLERPPARAVNGGRRAGQRGGLERLGADHL